MLKKNKFYVKFHNEIIAICDSNLIGKTLEDKELELKISVNFYKGELLDEERLIKIIKGANLNIVGKNIVGLCLKLKLIEKEHVLLIDKIPHAQMFEI